MNGILTATTSSKRHPMGGGEYDTMKLDKHLFKYKDTYCIAIYKRDKKLYIKTSTDYKKIMEIYQECVEADWQLDKLLEIKEKHRKHSTGHKYISFLQGKYIVFVPGIRENSRYCGTYTSLEDALHVRDELLRGNKEILDWMPRHKPQRIRKKRMRYVHPVWGGTGKYYINKSIDGKVVHFGTFDCLEDALWERDFLEAHDWDMSCYDLL